MSQLPHYCDGTLDGHFVRLVPDSHIEHNGQRVELPQGQNLLYIRIREDGQAFAGQGGKDDLCWEWNGQWTSHGPTVGVNPVIYRNIHPYLIIVRPGLNSTTGSQGWRYIDDNGSPVSADSTYASPAMHLWEYTTRGDITIGQGGDEEGLQALVRGRRVLLATGVARFIRFYRRGDRLAVFCVLNWTAPHVLVLSVADLDALPTYDPKPKPQPPAPQPPPQEPPVLNLESAIALIGVKAREIDRREPGVRVRDLARYTALVAAECFAIDPRIGRKRADPGRPISLSSLGIRHDVKQEGMTLMTVADFVRDETGEQVPMNPIRPEPILWPQVVQFWIKPEAVPGQHEDDGDATPPADPPKPPVQECNCAAQIEALVGDVADLIERLEKLEAKPAPKFVVRKADSEGIPTIGTSRVFGHSHEVRIVVVPE